MVLEILRFRLATAVDDSTFLEADRRVQTEFAYQQPGLLRRTTGRGRDGSWVVVDVWTSEEEAERCDERWGRDPVTEAFMSLVDRTSLRSERFVTLD